MKKYLYNKKTSKVIDMSHCSTNMEAFNEACKMFDLPPAKMTSRINENEYKQDKDTREIIITFGMEDWELHTDME